MSEQAPSKDVSTPRTDAVASDSWSGDAVCVEVDFARQLERELNELKQANAELLRRNVILSSAHEPRARPVPEVAGDMLPTSLGDFENRCKVWLDTEQAKASPCNALINLICDAIRLARENERMAKSGLGPPPVPELSELERAAMHFVEIVQTQRSPYIRENGRHQGGDGPWAELVDAVQSQLHASALTKGEGQ